MFFKMNSAFNEKLLIKPNCKLSSGVHLGPKSTASIAGAHPFVGSHREGVTSLQSDDDTLSSVATSAPDSQIPHFCPAARFSSP